MRSPSPGERQVRQLQRLTTLMDVVFALAMFTVFLSLPEIPEDAASVGSLYTFFVDEIDEFVMVLVGIVLITMYWIRNNDLLGDLSHTDNRHTAISIFQLFFLLFYLYAIGLGDSRDADTFALILQSASLALVGFAAVAARIYAVTTGGLTDTAADRRQARRQELRSLAEPITAIITIPCAFAGSAVWDLAWLAYPPLTILLNRRL